ncbi:uncharacterized protein LOC117669352 isoform X2 [Pantherophis guttatus]|uniref:Uncharacterized protein LOC117669352 isoform X2 n=1 Tax=Pantherophis guttatus TaxID=94885 RepID=A0A6P9CKF4_PANGU|nr:uncharacterized protein LOC117669352 isoform X2 [Pantherophis guttatus]
MYLLLIFALTFTLSTQLKNEDRMLERMLGSMGEEGLAQLMNSLEEKKLDRLMDCLEMECKDEEFVEIMPRVLEIIKGINGGKAGCSLIKTFIKFGYMYNLVTELREEDMIKIINELTEKHLQTLINMSKGKVTMTELVVLAKKLLPIIENAQHGTEVTKLIETLKNALQLQNSVNRRRSGRRSNNQGSSGGLRSGGQGDTNAANGGRMSGTQGGGGTQ